MIVALMLLVAAPGDAALFDPATGYRIAQYRAPVPSAPPGVVRIDDAQARALNDGGRALFIDVTPDATARRDPVSGTWRVAQPHDSIAGAHWFPDAGVGKPDPAIDAWFAHGIAKLAGGRRDTPIVVFCLADCWMSWNASGKLVRQGYRDVRWYANGIDGWREQGLRMAPLQPEP